MNHPKSPSIQEVLDSVKNMPTRGSLVQHTLDSENGLLYLDLDDDWIYNTLTVLNDYGYTRPPFFLYPPFPVGAHIKIVTFREARYSKLFERDLSHLIGKSVDFEVVTAHESCSRLIFKEYGIDARYKIIVRSPKLSRIRMELTNLSTGPSNGRFVILVGWKNPTLNDSFKEKQLCLVEEFENRLESEEKLDSDIDHD